MYLFLQPIQRSVLTVSVKLHLSDFWTQKNVYPKCVAHKNISTRWSMTVCVFCFVFFKWVLPFSSAMWCREAREREHLSSLVQAGNSSSMTTWSTGWNFPWAPRYKEQWTNQILINLDLEKKKGQQYRTILFTVKVLKKRNQTNEEVKSVTFSPIWKILERNAWL